MTRAKNGEDAIKYIRGNGKGHNGAAYRNEYFSGINMLPDSVVPFEKQMQIFWDKADRRHTTQVDRYFISYALSELNPDNPEDVLKAHNIGCEIAREIAPGHQAVVATQTDGKGHKIHTHIDVNDVNMETLKGLISTQYMHYKVREIADRVCQKYFDLASPAIAPEKESAAIRGKKYRDAKSKQKTYTWQDDLKERINDAAKGAVDEADFFSRLRDNGVEVEKRKATKTQPEYYLYELIDVTRFHGDVPKNLKSKSYKLGGNYQPETIAKMFSTATPSVQDVQQEQAPSGVLEVPVPAPKPTRKQAPKPATAKEKPSEDKEMEEARKQAEYYILAIMRQIYGWQEKPKSIGADGKEHFDFQEWDRQTMERDNAFEQFTQWRKGRRNELKKDGQVLPPIYDKDKLTGHISVLRDDLEVQFKDFLDQRDHPEKYIAIQEQPQAEPKEQPREQPKQQPPQEQTAPEPPKEQAAPAKQSQAEQEPQKTEKQRSALMEELRRINAASERQWKQQASKEEEYYKP